MKDNYYQMKNYILIALLLLIVYSCSENGGSGEEELDAPVLVSSTPEDGATDVAEGDITIVLSFDQNVTSPSSTHSQVTMANATITKVIANLKEVTIEASGLVESNTYELVIPKGVILGPTKVEAEEIRISFKTKEPVVLNITTTLATASPMVQAQNVYDYLLENYGTKILSATMSYVSWNINEAEWVNYHTGKYPAIATVDYIHLDYAPANWIDYTEISFLENWWDSNGIVSAGWHWNVPISEGSDENSFYSSGNSFSASSAIIDGTWENEVINADLEEIADYLLLLQAKNIPLLWRPLHEASGNYNIQGDAWFWWGNDGAEAYVALWKYMFNYFKDKGLNNLIWVWTTQIDDDAFYPGDAYVDIIGRDVYGNSDADDIAEQFTTIQETYPNKMVTMSEFGNVATISSQWSAGAKWSYFMPWYDNTGVTETIGSDKFIGTEHASADVDWWTDAVGNDVVITRDEVPSLK